MSEFFRKHRRKLIGSGVFIGGSYALYRYVKYKLEQHTEQRVQEMIEQSRKGSNFSANQESCLHTVVSFLPNLQTIIARTFDSQQLRTSLDENPHRKLEIWKELMILSVCRSVTSLYSLVLLYMLVRVQVNVLAGQMYNSKAQSSQSTSQMSRSSAVRNGMTDQLRKAYLSEMRHFLTDGLKKLMAIIERVVRQQLKNVSLKDKMTLSDMESLLTSIKNEVDVVLEGDSSLTEDSLNAAESSGKFTNILLPNCSSSNHSPATKAALEAESGSDLSIDNSGNVGHVFSPSPKFSISSTFSAYLAFRKESLLRLVPLSSSSRADNGCHKRLSLTTLLLQTRDVLDLPDFSSAVLELTETSLHFLSSLLADRIAPQQSSQDYQTEEELERKGGENYFNTGIAMAKWVPILDAQIYTLCKFDRHSKCLLSHLHANKTAKLFSENVYEAFLSANV